MIGEEKDRKREEREGEGGGGGLTKRERGREREERNKIYILKCILKVERERRSVWERERNRKIKKRCYFFLIIA